MQEKSFLSAKRDKNKLQYCVFRLVFIGASILSVFFSCYKNISSDVFQLCPSDKRVIAGNQSLSQLEFDHMMEKIKGYK